MLLLDWMAAESHTLAPYADNASKCPLSTMPARSARLAATGGSAAAATFCGAAVRARRSARMEHGQHCCAVAARCAAAREVVSDTSVRLELLAPLPQHEREQAPPHRQVHHQQPLREKQTHASCGHRGLVATAPHHCVNLHPTAAAGRTTAIVAKR